MKFVPVVLAIILSFTFHCTVAKEAGFGIKKATITNMTDHELFLEVAEKFQYAEKYTQNAMNEAFKKILPYVMEFSEKINVSQECMANTMHLIYGIKNIKSWAFKFLDASGKLPDGLFVGSVSAIGHFDQCLDIQVKSTRNKDFGKKLFQGQYCMIEVKVTYKAKKPIPQKMLEIPEEMKEYAKSDTIVGYAARYVNYLNIGGFRVGACVPTGCTVEDINSVLQLLVGQASSIADVKALRCEKKEENKYTPAMILVITFYALILFLVLAGSLLDICSSSTEIVKSKISRVLLAFSLVANFNKFCSWEQSSDAVACLNGMKFFGITWIVLGHTLMAAFGQFNHGYLKYMENTKGFAVQAIVNAMFSVDTFFLIGSFLVTYLFTKHIIMGKKRFSALMYIVHRLLRVYPTYIVLLTTVVLLPLMISGPFHEDVTELHLKHCNKNWWANLLFINNFYHPTEVCLMHSWYVTVDMQLYIFSLLFLITLKRWPKIGLSLVFFGIIAHIIFCGISTYVNEWVPVPLYGLMDFIETTDFFGYMYFLPFTHFGPYGIGLLLGYIYAMNPNVKMSRSTQVLGWCVAFTCSFSTLYGTRGWYLRPMPQYLSVIYASLSRTAWSIGPAWLIYCCATGHGGIINWILSWRIFIQLGRLSYCTYLIHLVVQLVFYSGLRTRVQPDLYVIVWMFVGHLIISYGIAFILHLLIEVPFANLERVLLQEARKEPESIEKDKNIVDNKSNEEKMCDIVILTPIDIDSKERESIEKENNIVDYGTKEETSAI